MLLVLCTICFLLSGCKIQLYGELPEQDANEIMAALLQHGVDASKSPAASGNNWSLEVERSQVVKAMQVLHALGLPHRKFQTFGELFPKDSLISTPTEERVRFIFGLSQELSETLSRIDGVLVARVQIVLPNNDPLADATKPSSAAVFIKYRPGSDVRALIPQIKTLVMHSVEGLNYDAVSVTAVPADIVELASSAEPGPGRMRWLKIVLALIAIACAAALTLGIRLRLLSQTTKPGRVEASGSQGISPSGMHHAGETSMHAEATLVRKVLGYFWKARSIMRG
jgi:type III secretion protein J